MFASEESFTVDIKQREDEHKRHINRMRIRERTCCAPGSLKFCPRSHSDVRAVQGSFQLKDISDILMLKYTQ